LYYIHLFIFSFTILPRLFRKNNLYLQLVTSELNPIEMVFSKVKSIVHKRKTNEKVEYLKRNIKYGFRKITGHYLKGYYEKSLKF
jgi:transposase